MKFGFKNEPGVPRALCLCQQQGLLIDQSARSCFLSREIVIPTRGAGMVHWRARRCLPYGTQCQRSLAPSQRRCGVEGWGSGMSTATAGTVESETQQRKRALWARP